MMENLLIALEIMGKGMGGIFVSILIIMGCVIIMGKIILFRNNLALDLTKKTVTDSITS